MFKWRQNSRIGERLRLLRLYQRGGQNKRFKITLNYETMPISVIKNLKNFYDKYERRASFAALLIGFALDSLTLRRVDLWIENLAIIFYLFAAGAAIVLINFHGAGRMRGRIFEKYTFLLPIVLQLVFGGLFSVFVVFYSRSASFAKSWPFILALAIFFVGNEFFRKRYLRLAFQINVYFVALFSYSVFAVHVLFGKMGADIFILSGFISIFLIGVFILLLFYTASEKIKQSRFLLASSIGCVYVVFHIFYFTNIIPPIPLSMKESGVYHGISRNDSGGYAVSYEPASWYYFFEESNSVFHWKRGEPIYFYSAVFAPTKINTNIFHRWSYFDGQKDKWIVKSDLSFPITGGRDGGYRGYSLKGNVAPGKWRVDVITDRGQILGRRTFSVVESDFSP